MEWLNRMMDALDYIETNLDKVLDMEVIAKKAYTSEFYFHRMFHIITGFTVSEYIRNRRLTMAAQELAVNKVKVIDVALKYGYETPESFTKAFRRLHGLSPAEVRNSGAKLKAFPRISFQISLKGDVDMDYKLVEKAAFKVIGKSIRVSTKDGENLKSIPDFWKEACESGLSDRLEKIAGEMGKIGICWNDCKNECFTYSIAVECNDAVSDVNLSAFTIPASTWAVFESVGNMPDAIQNVWKRIFSEWFPATNFEHADAPELEVYPQGNPDAADYRCEVWIPVIKK